MLEVRNISKSFRDLSVLRDIHFQAADGEIYGLIGYNGVGKTTLMKIMDGIYRPDSGGVFFHGEAVYENPKVKSDCFLLTEEIAYFDQSTLTEMARFYRGFYPNWSDSTFHALCKLFGISPDAKIQRGSKGMQRQCGLILAFSAGVHFLLLDEAFDGLDYSMRVLMKDMLRYYVSQKKACVVISSHNLAELEGLADKIALFDHGTVVYDCSLDELHRSYQVCRVAASDMEAMNTLPEAVMISLADGVASFLLKGSGNEAETLLKCKGIKVLEQRPASLEEFFSAERGFRSVDWGEIFG